MKKYNKSYKCKMPKVENKSTLQKHSSGPKDIKPAKSAKK